MANVYDADLREFVDDDRNANKGTARGKAMLDKSVSKLGAGRSILVDRNGKIIAGNKTRQAMVEAGIQRAKVVETDGNELVVVKRTDLDLDQGGAARELAYADNRVAEIDLNWDTVLLKEDADILADMFSDEELGLEVKIERESSDAVEEPNEEIARLYGTATGQLWVLGEHRLLIGDSTKQEDVERVMQGELADLVLTDPPYNLAGEADILAADVSKSMKKLQESAWDVNFDPVAALSVMPFAKNCSAYVFTSTYLFGQIFGWFKSMNWWSSICVWNKPNPMPSLTKRHWTHATEFCVHATQGKHVFNFPDEGHASNVWTFNQASDGSHPTQKAIELIRHIMKHSSLPGQLVFDGFGGSGTTLIAAEDLGRRARLVEMDTKYAAVILRRWEAATGGKAILC